jgi:membrane-associated phospholipid phosphatase
VHRRPPLLGEIVVVLVLVKVYDRVRALEAARAGPALAHARAVLGAERFLHLDVELAATRWLAGHPAVSTALSWWYQLAHLTITLGVLAWCYVARPDRYRRLRTALALTNVAGLVVFLSYPVMPPRLLPGGAYADAVATAGFGTTHGGPVPADQYAAMPSLHLAWAVWTAAVLHLLLPRRLRWLAVAHPLLTSAAVVLTGNHYVLDVLAGTAVALLALLVTRPTLGSDAELLPWSYGRGSTGGRTGYRRTYAVDLHHRIHRWNRPGRGPAADR